MTDTEFVELVTEIILPVLEPFGFKRVPKRDGWIAPQVLFESCNRWFAASWDVRDSYLDVSLGRLFLFRDVRPRVVVRGPLSVTERNDREVDVDFVRRHLDRTARRLPSILERFDELYSRWLTHNHAHESSQHLGPEVTTLDDSSTAHFQERE